LLTPNLNAYNHEAEKRGLGAAADKTSRQMATQQVWRISACDIHVLMNRRRILASLGLAPIAAIPAVKAIASEETLGSWLRRTQCVMRDADANEIALGEFATETFFG
jgi:Fe2+ transport system protein FeoA